MVGPVEGDGQLRPPEKRRRRRFGRIDLPTCELLAAPGLVGRWASKYHKVVIEVREAIILPLGATVHQLRPLLLLPLPGTSRLVLFHEGAALI
jgi:hypothetical protein